MNPVAAAIAAAAQATRQVAGETVRYRRGETYTDADPVAVFSHSGYDHVDHDGRTTRELVDDVLLAAEALSIAGQVLEPEVGDVVERTLGDRVLHHEVLPPAGGASAWSYRDPSRLQLRLHTKHIGTEHLP
jgi:hypothetical protein